MILALDPATKTGWALSAELSGTWDFAIKRDESAGMRLLRLKAKLTEVCRLEKVTLVVYEAARVAAPGMQGSLVHQAKLQGVIELFCIENGLEYKGYGSTEIKKHATGKGNANKDQMVVAAQRFYPGVQVLDDNHGDALCLLHLAREEFCP